MRAPWRFALAVLVAFAAAEAVSWAFLPAGSAPNALAFVRIGLLAALGFALVRFAKRDAVVIPLALIGALAVEEGYLAIYGAARDYEFDAERLLHVDLIVLALARGFGLLLAARGKARWIDGLLIAVPVIVADFILSAVSAVRALGESFGVGAVTPHLVQVLAWGAVVAVVHPLVAGRQRE